MARPVKRPLNNGSRIFSMQPRRSLFTPNFILLILGQLTSLFGNFILKLALSMYVLEVTGSAAAFAGILSQIIAALDGEVTYPG